MQFSCLHVAASPRRQSSRNWLVQLSLFLSVHCLLSAFPLHFASCCHSLQLPSSFQFLHASPLLSVKLLDHRLQLPTICCRKSALLTAVHRSISPSPRLHHRLVVICFTVVLSFQFLLQISNSATSAHFPSLGLQPAQLLSRSQPCTSAQLVQFSSSVSTASSSSALAAGHRRSFFGCRRWSFSKLDFRSWSTSLASLSQFRPSLLATATARYIQFAPTLFISSCVAWLHLSAICLLFTTASSVIF